MLTITFVTLQRPSVCGSQSLPVWTIVQPGPDSDCEKPASLSCGTRGRPSVTELGLVAVVLQLTVGLRAQRELLHFTLRNKNPSFLKVCFLVYVYTYQGSLDLTLIPGEELL